MASHGSYSERTFCPHCGERLDILRLNLFVVAMCPACGSLLTVSSTYRIVTQLLSLAISLLLAGSLGVKAYSAIVWVPLLVLSIALVPNFTKLLFPPKLNLAPVRTSPQKVEPWRRNLRLLLVFWFGQTLFLLGYGLVLGWASYVLGGTQRDIRETCDFFSAPLVWFNSSFEISPKTNLPTVMGILFANSFFYAAMYTALTRIVQSRLRKPITQLGISTTSMEDDDDDV